MRACVTLLFILIAAFPVRAQAPAAPATVNVYMDCPIFACDQDFVRTEISYVSWVRDRAAADVHILITQQATGGGGTEYTLAFLGLQGFAGVSDTLKYVSGQSSTSDDVRRGLTRTIKLGLVPYLSRTTIADRLSLSVAPAATTDGPAPAASRDRWNLWVFSLGANTNLNGERTQQFNSVSGNLGARRTTETWKLSFTMRGNYRESKFDFDGVKSVFIQRSYSFNQLAVKSLGPRLSAGLRSSLGSSTFENKRFNWRVTPAVEYDLFPYSESTRRIFTMQYAAGLEGSTYNEETIYFKTEETRPVHSLSLNLNQNQPWGNVNVGAEAGQYLDETNRNFAAIFGGVGLRLFKGFNFNLSGNFSSIHNQLYLARRGATPEEVLLQQRRLQSNYSYFAFTGISYTFGSVFNTIVNPRFGRDGGGSSCFCF